MEKIHVPAWKRLGLKLKYAKEDPSDSPTIPSTINGSRKIKFDDIDDSPPPSTLTNDSTPKPNGEGPPAKKQKRVSFSTDTKLVDGDTARSALPSEVTDALAAAKNAKASQPKKSNKPQTAPSKHKSEDALDYLRQYYYEHDTWKFTKTREIWVLKHALSTEDVPLSYNLPLAQYIYRLKSQGARERLRAEVAEELRLHTDSKQPTSRSTNSASHEATLKSSLSAFPNHIVTSQDDPISLWLNSDAITRHELLLQALNPNPSPSPPAIIDQRHDDRKAMMMMNGTDEPATPLENARDKAAQRKKMKKVRTAAVVEHSSESESSESSSEGESEEETSSDEDDVDEEDGADEEGTSSSGSDSDSTPERTNGT